MYNRNKNNRFMSNSRITKIFLALIFFLFCAKPINAQSNEIREAYKQVARTFKDYYFRSGDIYFWADYTKTKSISFVVQNGYFVFTFNDDYGVAYQLKPEECKQGIKKIRISIQDVVFSKVSGSNYYYFSMSCEDGVEYTYKNKKDILREYHIGGKEMSLLKLRKELIELRDLINKEGFKGSLGVSSSNKKKTNSSTPSSHNSNNKKVGRYVQ